MRRWRATSFLAVTAARARRAGSCARRWPSRSRSPRRRRSRRRSTSTPATPRRTSAARSRAGTSSVSIPTARASARPARLDLRLDATRGEHLHFFTAIRAGYDGKIGNPDRGNPILDLDDAYQDKDLYVDFDEAYLDVYFESFEVRLGKQKVSWGQLDDLQPTDHLNPEDLTEFYFPSRARPQDRHSRACA